MSKGLMEDVQTLLLRLGIVGQLSRRTVLYDGRRLTAWRVCLSGHQAVDFTDRYLNLLSSRSLRRQPDLKEPKQRRDAASRVPIAFLAKASKDDPRLKTLLNNHNFLTTSSIGRNRQKQLATLLLALDKPQLVSQLRGLQKQNVWWDEVREVRFRPAEQTYSVTIPKNPVYVCENTIAHNTTVLIGLIVWAIGDNPNIRIKLFAQSEDKARERLGVVADLIARNKLVKLVFPHLRAGRNAPWHKSAIQVERDISDKEPTLEASGIMGSVEGGRADLVVFDDISDFRTSMVYPQHREAIKKKVYAEVLPMLEEDGRAISIATPHHELDVVASLRKNRQWRSEVYSVGTDEDPFIPLWPKRWPRESLIKLRNEIGPLEYDRALRCKAISGALAMLKPEYIRFYDAKMLGDPNNLVCVQAYDLAISQNRKSSWFACVTVLYNIEKNLAFVADAWHAKLGFAEQAIMLVEQSKIWQPNRIVVEETGYQAALRGYLMEVAKEPLPIYPIKPGNLSKELRLMEAMPMFAAGRVFFNPRLDPQVYIERTSIGDIVGQLREFPQGTDKDLVDALAYAVKSLRSFQEEEGDEDWEDGEGLGARISVF